MGGKLSRGVVQELQKGDTNFILVSFEDLC
jgi:hypothetical protein